MRNDTKLDILWDDVQELKASGGGGGGSDLPDVTEADDGKILGVVNGAWNKMDAPSGAIDYSTTEQNTGRKWIDGKDIYQKTFIDETTFSGSSTHTHNIPNSLIDGIHEVISVESKALIGSEYYFGSQLIITPGTSSSNLTNYIRIGYDNTDGVYEYGKLENAFTATKFVITLFYTKNELTKATKKKTTKNKED